MPDTFAPSLDSSPSSHLRGKRVVVVEDEGITIMMLRQVLQRKRAHVVAICRSVENLDDLVSEHKPDLLVLGLPPHAEPEVVASARAASGDDPPCIVLMTTHVTRDHKVKLIAAGAAAVVEKPFTAERLMHEIEEAYRLGTCTPSASNAA